MQFGEFVFNIRYLGSCKAANCIPQLALRVIFLEGILVTSCAFHICLNDTFNFCLIEKPKWAAVTVGVKNPDKLSKLLTFAKRILVRDNSDSCFQF